MHCSHSGEHAAQCMKEGAPEGCKYFSSTCTVQRRHEITLGDSQMRCSGVLDGPEEIVDKAVHPISEHKWGCPPMFDFSCKIEGPEEDKNYLEMFRRVPQTDPPSCFWEPG